VLDGAGGRHRGARLPTGADDWPLFLRLTAVVVVRSVLFFGLTSFLGLHFIDDLHATKAEAGVALTAFLFAGASGTLLGGWLADRAGKLACVRLGFALAVPALLGLVLATSQPLALVFVVLTGAAVYLPFSVFVMLGQDYLPNRIGTASGVTVGLAVSVGGLTSPLLGVLADLASLRVALSALLALPVLVYWIYPPSIKRSPEVPKWAAGELAKMGGMTIREIILTVLVLIAITLWVVGGDYIDAATTAFIVVSLMLVAGIITWDDMARNNAAWTTICLLALLVTMADGLARSGFIKWFAVFVADHIGGLPPATMIVALVSVYFFSHYMFASLTAHTTAMLPVVLAVGIFLYVQADNFEFEQASGRIGPGAWPKIILVMMVATALWGVVSSALRAGHTAPEAVSEAEQDEALTQLPEIYPALVWIAVALTTAYLLLLPILGFFIATIVYTCVLMYLGHYRRPLRVALLSLAIALCFMFMFMRVVYVSLPPGVAPFDQLSYALMAAMGVH